MKANVSKIMTPKSKYLFDTLKNFERFVSKQDKNRFYNLEFDHFEIRTNFILKILDPIVTKAKFKKETIFLAISLMDAFLSINESTLI